MGGNSGGGLLPRDLQHLENVAKRRLKGARHVFISFAEEDLNEVNLLRGQAANDGTELEFDDYSVKAPYDSSDADYIRRQIKAKIEKVSVTLVYLSPSSAASKWVNWEIEESLRQGKSVIGIYSGDGPPKSVPSALKKNGCKVVKWTHDGLMTAIDAECADRE